MPTTKLTAEVITAAIEGFESQKTRIDAQIAQLKETLNGGQPGPAAVETPERDRHKMSAAGRARIAAAQRKRWAESKKASDKATPESAARKRRKLSAAGRKRISEATKARWARVRAEAKPATKKVAKKVAGKKSPAKRAAATAAAGQAAMQ